MNSRTKFRVLFLLPLLFFAQPAAASRSFTIASFPCTTPKGHRWPLPDAPGTLFSQGYGFLFRGKAYLVTSHHHVYNGNEEKGVCHASTFSDAYPIRLLAWDWGAGLALFESPPMLGMEPLPEPLSASSQGVALTRNGDYGRVIAVGSDRHHIPLLPSGRVDELDSIRVASWQVGAPVFTWFDRGGGLWKGIVSHQYVAMLPGRDSRVETWDADSKHVESHVLMIGKADIYKFLERYFANPEGWRPSIGVDLDDRLGGRSRVRVGGLYFEEECSEGCQVRVYRNVFGSWKDYDPSIWPERARKLFADLRTHLSEGGSALIPFAFFRDARKRIIPYSNFSLQYFFRQLAFEDRKDVVLYENPKEVSELARAASRLAKLLPAKGNPADPQSQVNLEVRLPALLAILQSDSWRMVTASDVEELSAQDPEGLLAAILGSLRAAGNAGEFDTPQLAPSAGPLPDVHYLDTVKVISRLQGDPLAREGSGLLFSQAGRIFAVTSDHALHANEELSVTAIRAGKLPSCGAKLLAQDPQKGLALLELPGCSLKAPPFPELARISRGLEVITEGFAYGSRTLQADQRGTVRSIQAKYAFLPVDFPLVEISGAAGEFGMSGGVVSTDKGQYVGVLSHQQVKFNDKTDTDAPLWRNGRKVENHLIVIPGSVVKNWIDLKIADQF